MRTRPPTRFHKIITNVFRGLSICLVPVACSVPSALNVYWVASSSYGLMQNLILASPQVKRTFGIPLTQTELKNPYEHMWMKIKQRTGLEKLPVEVKVVEKPDSEKPTNSKQNQR